MLYLDTSVLVAALTREVATEFSAALSVKARMGTLRPDERVAALAGFRRLVAASLEMFPVEGADFARAMSLADQSELGLKAGDALHLAIAIGRGAGISTLDRRLAEAAKTSGVGVEVIREN